MKKQNKTLPFFLVALAIGFTILQRSSGRPPTAPVAGTQASEVETKVVPPAPTLKTAAGLALGPLQVRQNSLMTERLASLVNSLSSPTEALSVSELNAAGGGLSSEDMRILEQNVLNQNLDGNTRRASLFILTHSAVANAGTALALARIAQSPVPKFENGAKPHSRGSFAKSFEVSLRITALESLDQRAVNSTDVAKHIKKISHLQKDPTLSLLTQISLAGIAAGTPGKLNRTIQAMLQETAQ